MSLEAAIVSSPGEKSCSSRRLVVASLKSAFAAAEVTFWSPIALSSARMRMGDNEVILVSHEINKSNGPATRRQAEERLSCHVGLSECRQLVLHIDFTDSGRWLN